MRRATIENMFWRNGAANLMVVRDGGWTLMGACLGIAEGLEPWCLDWLGLELWCLDGVGLCNCGAVSSSTRGLMALSQLYQQNISL